VALDVFDIATIDEVVHGRLRLGVLAVLAGAEAAEFNELKSKLHATDGNLSVHLRKLEDAGYVTIKKTFANRKPLTRVRLTKSGRTAFLAYLETISRLVEANQ
jgi:DNA-binding MarR family transcriptional regulator